MMHCIGAVDGKRIAIECQKKKSARCSTVIRGFSALF